MKRIDLIANHSVETDIMEALRESGIKGYTKIPVVHGAGNSNPKMGTGVWPEENFMLVIYADEESAERLKNLVAGIKKHFPGEGIKYFELGQG